LLFNLGRRGEGERYLDVWIGITPKKRAAEYKKTKGSRVGASY